MSDDGYKGLFLDKQDELLKATRKALDLQIQISEFEKFHPRAVKLLRKQKKFIVIAVDEPYFIEAFSLIRQHEQQKGTWDESDEASYQRDAVEHRWLADAPNRRCPKCHALLESSSVYCDTCGTNTPRQ
jgi:hypothetical protein